MKKTYDYLSKYEELKNLYLETNEVFEFKPEEIEEIVETIIYEEKIDSLSYDGLNESQISFLEEVKKAISNNSDNIKKAFKAFKKSFDEKELNLDDLKCTFLHWIIAVPKGLRKIYISCYKSFIEKIIQDNRLNELLEINKGIIEKEIVTLTTHYEGINKKLYNSAKQAELKKHLNKAVSALSKLNPLTLNIANVSNIKNEYYRNIKSVKTIEQIKKRKRIIRTTIISSVVAIVAFVLIGFIPVTQYEVVHSDYILNNYNNLKNDLNRYHNFISSDDKYEKISLSYGYYARVTGVKGLIWDGHFKPRNVTIKSEYDGYPVVSIANYALSGNDKLKTINLPDTIRYIDSYAFNDCNNLKNVYFEGNTEENKLPDNLESIGYSAFNNTAIENIKLPLNLKVLSKDSFDENTNVDYPDSSSVFDSICIGKPKYSVDYKNVTIFIVDKLEKSFALHQFEVYDSFQISENSTSFTIPKDKIPYHYGYTLEGFTFYEESKLVIGSDGVYQGAKVDKTIYLFTYFEPIVYNITYNLNGGTLTSPKEEYTIESSFNLKDPYKTGYTFEGWYTNSSFSGSPVDSISLGTTGNKTFYAKFTPNDYKILASESSGTISITYDYNYSGSSDYTVTYNQGDDFNYLTPSRSYYIFRGWFTDSACTEIFDENSHIYDGMTLYAGWYYYGDTSGYSLSEISMSTYSNSKYVSSSSSSSNRIYLYYVVKDCETHTLHYSLSYGYSFYFSIYNETQGYTIKSNSTFSNISYQTFDITANPGDVISIRLYDYSGSSEYFNYYFSNYSEYSIDVESILEVVEYDSEYTLTYTEIPGYRFIGYYTGLNGSGVKITDETGKSLATYTYTHDLTVYPYYNPIVYTITYNENEGTIVGTKTETYTIESASFDLPTATKTGYTFNGWYENCDFSGTAISSVPTGSYGDLTLYAKFTANNYKIINKASETISITYDYNYSGASDYTVTYNQGDDFNYLTPSRSYYIFRGWFTDEACTSIFDDETTIYNGMKLYAGWYYYGGTSGYSLSTISMSTSSSSKYVSSSSSSSNRIYLYYVVKDCETHTLHYSSSYGYGCYFSIYNETQGYTIRSNSSFSSTSYQTFDITANPGDVISIRLYDYNSYSEYFYYYFSNYSEYSLDVESVLDLVEYNTEYTLTYTEIPGYRFKGYYTAQNGQGTKITDETGKSLANYTYTSDLDVYPYYEYATYTITYNEDEGTIVGTKTETYNIESASFDLPTATKTGYTFNGWYENSDFSGSSISNIPTGSYGDLTLYAKFTPNTYNVSLREENYTINYDYNYEGATTTSRTYTVGENIYLTAPSRSYYIFRGWFTDEACTSILDDETTIYNGMTLYAGWEYYGNVYYYSMNVIEQTASTYSTYINTSSSSSNKIYLYYVVKETGTHDFYYSFSSSYGAYMLIYNETDDVTIVSNYRHSNTYYSSYSISADAGDVISIRLYDYSSYSNTFYYYFGNYGSSNVYLDYSSITVDYDSAFEIPYSTIPGYRFKGYYTSPNGEGTQITDETGKSLANYTYTSDTVVYPYYEYATYTITYNEDEGTIVGTKTETYTIDTASFDLPTATKTGYTFNGWYEDSDFSGTAISSIPTGSYGDLTLYAKFTPNTYKINLSPIIESQVTLDYNYNNLTSTIDLSYGETLPYPEIPERTGYVFAGWYKDADCTQYFDFTEVITDITLYAKWIAHSGNSTVVYVGETLSSIYVISRNSTTNNSYYYAFVPLVSGTISITSSANFDTYGYLYDSNKNQLSYNDDGASNAQFLITYSVNAGQLYYIRPCGYSSSGYMDLIISGTSTPSSSSVGIEVISVTVSYNSSFTLVYLEREGYTFKGYYTEANGLGTKITDEYGKSLVDYNYTGDITAYAYYE